VDTALVAIAFVAAIVLIFAAIGRWHPGSGADVLDWGPRRSPELEAQLEEDDLSQMIEARNERRRRAGKPELTEDEVRADVAAAEREQRERARRWQAERPGGAGRPTPREPT
jgi:hypothetical protein